MTGPFDQGPSGPSGSPFGGSAQPASGGPAHPGPFGSPAGPGGGSDSFASSGSTAATASAPVSTGGGVNYTSGPWAPLIAAVVTAVVGLVIAIIPMVSSMTATMTNYVVLAAIAWVLCGVVTFILAGRYTMKDNKLRANSVYVAKDSQKTLYWVALGIGSVGVLLTAIEIALWASKF